MRTLEIEERKQVAGGDHPGMGPYAAPVTAEICRAYAEAQYRLLVTGGAALGLAHAWVALLTIGGHDAAKNAFFNSCMTHAASHNARNGYSADGTTYLGSGGPSGTTSWNPSATDMVQQAHNDLLDMMKPTGSNIF